MIAPGVQYSVRDFVEAAAGELGIGLEWQGTGAQEIGRVARIESKDASSLKVGQVIVQVDPIYFRPSEVQTLLGDATKAKTQLGWEPAISFKALVEEMMREDLQLAKRDELSRSHGHRTYNLHE